VTGGSLAVLARTAVHLKPSQAAQRARLRAQRIALSRSPRAARWLLAGPDPAAGAGWPAGPRPLDAALWRTGPGLGGLGLGGLGLGGLSAGRIELLGLARTLATPASPASGGLGWADGDRPDRDWACRPRPDWDRADWQQRCAPQLWRFHLHYWDWAWALAADPDRAAARALFSTLWRSWREAVPPGRGDAWLPYPTALRAWSYCGLHRDLVAGSEIDGCFVADLAAHAGFLRRHVESDVGGNHLIKNLKALTGLAIFLRDDRLLTKTIHRLNDQLPVQLLPDGGHYERAPAYHCQVLADLIDVADLLRAAGQAPGLELIVAIRRMRRWLAGVLCPDGSVPLLNDGYPVDADLLAAVRPWPAPRGPLHVLPDTGLVRAAAGGWHLLADVGPACPAGLPAHAHADTLGCLVHLDGEPLLVDTGTSTYAPGRRRCYERSTAAHNTVEVDGTDSTEVWAAFRAGRRARVHEVMTHADAAAVTVEASHDGFRGLPGRPRHHRRWSLTAAGLGVDDLITGRGRHTVVIRWHLAAGSAVRLDDGSAVITTPAGDVRVTVSASAPAALTAETAQIADGFGRTLDAPVLTCRIDAALPVRVAAGWRRASDWQPAPGITAAAAADDTDADSADADCTAADSTDADSTDADSTGASQPAAATTGGAS
jgi:uncharacterized heparinase superfamily protein